MESFFQPSQNGFAKYALRNESKGRLRARVSNPALQCYPAAYPESTNKTRLITTVRVTLKRTLTKSQNRHPLPISSRGLQHSRSRSRDCLHLEHYLFRDRFEVAHNLRLPFRA
jgi:hypothetical protein